MASHPLGVSSPLQANNIQSDATSENTAVYQPLLIDELWEDLGFGFDDNWCLPGADASWGG